MKNCPKCNQPIPEGNYGCPSCSKQRNAMNPEITAHINLLKKKLQTEPSNAKLYIDLGDIFHKQGLLDEALNEYQKAVDIEPENYNALIKSARIYLKFKQLTKAEKAFHTALRVNPRSTTSLIGLFRIYYLAGKTDEAIVLGEKIIKAVPDSLEFHMLLKNLYKRKGDKKKMLLELQKIETLVPDNAEVLKELWSFYMDDNNTERMKEYYQKLKDRNLTDVDLLFRTGKYYFDNSYFDTAVDYFNDVLKHDGVTPALAAKSRSHLILIHFNKSDISITEQLINEFDPAYAEYLDAEIKKKVGAACYKIGQDEIKHGNPKKAITLLQKATVYDRESSLYKETLNTIKGTVALTNKKFVTKIAMIAGGAIAACVILILFLSLTRNKIFMRIEPSDDIAVMIDGKTIRTHADGSGIISSPTLPVGTHDLEIRKAGYEPWTGSVHIAFGRSSRLDLTLVPVYCFFKMVSVPESVDVFIDGELAGSTPFLSDSVLACSHTITVEERGYMKWDTIITPTGSSDSVILDTVILKNLTGKWRGNIGVDSYAYDPVFDMTITQTDTVLTVRFDHKPRDDSYYSGKIKGYIKNKEFYAEGAVTNKYYRVFYWAQEKKNVILQGYISDDWDRIQGKYQVEGAAEQSWWAARSQ